MHDGDLSIAPALAKIYKALKKWETQPDRREAFTLKLLDHLRATVREQSLHEDSIEAALCDWFECGLFGGFRLSEWAQNASEWNPSAPQLDIFDDTKAFCLDDLTFEKAARKRISAVAAANDPDPGTIVKCWIRFRTQKNGQNHEERFFVRNTTTGGHCFITAALNIIRRFIRVRGHDDRITPLALYTSTTSNGETRLITSKQIEDNMQMCAAAVHGITNDADLQFWSAHSLRVGACELLHSRGFTGTQIKWTLRWRSDSFMVYLRNNFVLSTAQNRIFDEASSSPPYALL